MAGLVCGISCVASAADLGYSSSQGGATHINSPSRSGATHINSSSRGGAAYIKPSQLQKQNIERQPTSKTLRQIAMRARQSFFQEEKVLFDKRISANDVKPGTTNRDDLHKKSYYTLDDLALHEAVQLGNASGLIAIMNVAANKSIKDRKIREAFLVPPFYPDIEQYIDDLSSLALSIQNQPQSKQASASERQHLVASKLLNETFRSLIDQPESINIAEAAQLQHHAGGATLLHMALSASSLNTAKLLVQNGASLLQASNSMTPLQQLQEQVKNLKTVVTELRIESVWRSGQEVSYRRTSFFSDADNMVMRQNDIDMFKADEERRLNKLKKISKILKVKAKVEARNMAQGDMAKGDRDKKIKDCIQLLQELGVEFKLDLKK